MSFLALNGMPIPVARGGEEENQAIGFDFTRSHSGGPLTDARAYKRMWRFQTIPLQEITARALIGLIQGRGFNFPFDTTSYAANGLAPTTSVRTLRAGLATDTSTVYDENGTLEAQYGSSSTGGAVAVETGTTNLLYAIATNGPNICSGTDSLSSTGGFTAIAGGGIASNSGNSLQGSRSLALTPAAAGDGVRTSFATTSANGTVTASVYIKGTSTSTTYRLKLFQNSGAPALLATGSTVTPISGGSWKRMTLTATLTGGNTTCAVQVESVSAGTNACLLDQFQLEALAYATSWVGVQDTHAVTNTRAAGGIICSGTPFVGWSSTTLACWAVGPTTSPAARCILLDFGGLSSNYITLDRNAATNHIRVSTTAQSIAYSSNPWDNNWHHVAVVARINPEASENALTIYFDGASVATAATDAGFTGGTSSSVLGIGVGNGGTVPWTSGRIDDVRIVPYAMSAAEITGLYSLGTAGGAIPQIFAAGDFIEESSINVLGEVHKATFAPHQAGGAWRKNGRIIDFTLYEV